MELGGVDDELIKSTQTRLIQMGATGKQVADVTPLILDMSKATGKDLLTSTLAVGKALGGNVGRPEAVRRQSSRRARPMPRRSPTSSTP